MWEGCVCVCVDPTKVTEEGTGLPRENCKEVIFLFKKTCYQKSFIVKNQIIFGRSVCESETFMSSAGSLTLWCAS